MSELVPAEFEGAYRDFDHLLRDARDEAGLVSINQAYTMVEGVLRVFRRRLTLPEAIAFANVLPLLVRALFISDWDTSQEPLAFGDRTTMTEEVQALRSGHNFSPRTSIHDVAVALRQHVDQAAFDAVVTSLPEAAVQFWDSNRPLDRASERTNICVGNAESGAGAPHEVFLRPACRTRVIPALRATVVRLPGTPATAPFTMRPR